MSHIVIQDPSDLSSRFSNKDRLGYDGFSDLDIEDLIARNLSPAPEQDLVEEGQTLPFDLVEPYLPRIPPRESDLITLYFRDHMKQEQIARLFGITQAAVSYRLHRGIKRIQFLRTIPELEEDIFQRELGPKFTVQDMEILWRMYETTCQSAIAKEMGLTQGRVRHRFFRALSRIRDLIEDDIREREVDLRLERKHGKDLTPDEFQIEVDSAAKNSKFGKYWTVFYAISDKHFNILHEVSLPQFKDRGDAQIISIEHDGTAA